jgi:pyridoxine kinase
MAIHDISCVGRCSLTVALPILSAGGFDCGVLPTAVLSTHTGGFTGFTYRDLTEDINPIATHWKSLGLKFDALYSGFLGSFDQIELVAEIFDNFKDEGAVVLVDPVMADNGKLYSIYSPEMARGMAGLCSHADIIAPNLTEAAFLLGEEYKGDSYDKNYVEGLLKRLTSLGSRKIVLTGVSFEPTLLGAASYDADEDKIDYYFNEKVDGYFHGTGDVFSSSLLAALMRGFSLGKSIEVAVEYTLRCIKHTDELNLERRYGVSFELALPYLIDLLGLSQA